MGKIKKTETNIGEAEKKVLKAVCGSPETPLRIGNIEIPAYVLEDETRVLSLRGVVNSLNTVSVDIHRIAKRLTTFKDLNPEISPIHADLLARIVNPIVFLPPHGGRTGYGYEATILVDICEVILDAKKRDALFEYQVPIAENCEILLRGFARIGIIALVDEATGFEKIKRERSLAQIFKRYISPDLMPWQKRFPDEFYKELFRLRGWQWKGREFNPPQVVGSITKNIIYARLAPGIIDELERKNPPVSPGQRAKKHHQWLTSDVGHPELDKHINAVMALMRASSNWSIFKRNIERAFPKLNEQLWLDMEYGD